MTVVFIDVEGSTSLLERLGDEAGSMSVQSVIEVARGLLNAHSGREVKALGDGLMIAFESPRQAVAYGLAVQRGLERSTIRLRIGINTGDVEAPHGDPLGGAVNAAARIAGKADGGEVWVSDVVRQLVGPSRPTSATERRPPPTSRPTRFYPVEATVEGARTRNDPGLGMCRDLGFLGGGGRI